MPRLVCVRAPRVLYYTLTTRDAMFCLTTHALTHILRLPPNPHHARQPPSTSHLEQAGQQRFGLRLDVAGKHQVLLENTEARLHEVSALERRSPHNQLVAEHAERPVVDLLTVRLLEDDLWGHVRRGPHHALHLAAPEVRVPFFGHPEVCENGVALRRQENILQLATEGRGVGCMG